MITATILAFSGFAAPQQPIEPDGSALAPPDDLAMVVEYEETHVTFQSLSEADLFLVFAREDPELSTGFWLRSGTRYEEDFPRGTLDGVRFDVLIRDRGQWKTTGVLTLDSSPTYPGELWVLSCGHALAGEGGNRGLELENPDGSLLPPSLLEVVDLPQDSHDLSAPRFMHVPVQTPTDKPKGDKPPKLDKDPLPAV
jgi:hypothetical protein